jgi:hypothetical protein
VGVGVLTGVGTLVLVGAGVGVSVEVGVAVGELGVATVGTGTCSEMCPTIEGTTSPNRLQRPAIRATRTPPIRAVMSAFCTSSLCLSHQSRIHDRSEDSCPFAPWALSVLSPADCRASGFPGCFSTGCSPSTGLPLSFGTAPPLTGLTGTKWKYRSRLDSKKYTSNQYKLQVSADLNAQGFDRDGTLLATVGVLRVSMSRASVRLTTAKCRRGPAGTTGRIAISPVPTE